MLCYFAGAFLFVALALVSAHSLTHRYWAPAQEELTKFLRDTPDARWDYPLIQELDGLYWTEFARQLVTEGRFRVRETDLDNAPYARPVHWCSLPLWGIAGLGALFALFTGSSWEAGTLSAAVWINPLLMLVGFLSLSVIIGKRISWVAAALFLIGSQGFLKIYYHFALAAPDHHSWFNLAYAVHLLFLGLVFWDDREDPRHAKRSAAISGAAAGVMLWVGATQAALLLTLSGFAVFFLQFTWLFVEPPGHSRFPPRQTWLWWGGTGALVSLLAYLVEYAPNHMGMHLEVNHPLYALSFLAAGVALYAIQHLVLDGKPSAGGVALLIGAILAGFLPAVLLLILRDPEMHAMLDPVIWRYHRDLSEFEPLFSQPGHAPFALELVAMALLVLSGAILVLARFRQNPRRMSALLLAVLATALLSVGGYLQNRWLPLGNMSALVLLALIYGFGVSTLQTGTGSGWQRSARITAVVWTILLVTGHVVLLTQFYPADPLPHSRVKVARHLLMLRLGKELHESLPANQTTPIVILVPNEAEGMGQLGFSQCRLVGSQYWENREGLRDVQRILAVPDLAEAHALIRQRGVTHIVMAHHHQSVADPMINWHGKILPESLGQETLAFRLAGPRPHPPDWLKLIIRVPTLRGDYEYLVYQVNPAE